MGTAFLWKTLLWKSECATSCLRHRKRFCLHCSPDTLLHLSAWDTGEGLCGEYNELHSHRPSSRWRRSHFLFSERSSPFWVLFPWQLPHPSWFSGQLELPSSDVQRWSLSSLRSWDNQTSQGHQTMRGLRFWGISNVSQIQSPQGSNLLWLGQRWLTLRKWSLIIITELNQQGNLIKCISDLTFILSHPGQLWKKWKRNTTVMANSQIRDVFTADVNVEDNYPFLSELSVLLEKCTWDESWPSSLSEHTGLSKPWS